MRRSDQFHRQLTSLQSQICSLRCHNGPIKRTESQMTVFEPSTDCSVRERDQPTERRAAKGDRAFGGEEGGGREGCCQLLARALPEPAGAIFQWVRSLNPLMIVFADKEVKDLPLLGKAKLIKDDLLQSQNVPSTSWCCQAYRGVSRPFLQHYAAWRPTTPVWGARFETSPTFTEQR